MKKIIIFTVLILALSVTSFASDGDIDSYSDTYSYSELCDGLSDEAKEILNEIGIDELSFDSIFSVSPGKIFDSLFSLFKSSLKEPFRYLIYGMGVVILSALFGSFGVNNKIMSIISLSSVAILFAVPITKLVGESFSVITSVANYNTVISGVLCGIISSSGGVVSGTSYSAFTAFFFNIISEFCNIISKPLINGMCFFAFFSCFSVYDFHFRVSELLKKIYIWALGLSGTLFTGILSIKTLLSSSYDSLSLRGIKFLVGKSLPVVGGVISESCTALLTSFLLLKNTVGVFGIISVVITVLPVILKLICWLLSFSVMEILDEMLMFNEANKSIGVFKSVITLLFATVLFVALLLVISIGTLLLFTQSKGT